MNDQTSASTATGSPASRVLTVERTVAAPASTVFGLIADPENHVRWDAHGNVARADAGQQVRAVGDEFLVEITSGRTIRNTVVEFEPDRRIAWTPARADETTAPGHLWRWETIAVDDSTTLVRHTYDWTALADERRIRIASGYTREGLLDSVDRLAVVAQDVAAGPGLPPVAERIVTAERTVRAPAEVLFELIADPSRQPDWDGNDNLARAAAGQRVRAVGDVFTTELTKDAALRENHVVEFEEGRRIAWLPAPAGEQPRGHCWRWELEPAGDGATLVRHTYDWRQLGDETRFPRALATTPSTLRASMDRLAVLAEAESRG